MSETSAADWSVRYDSLMKNVLIVTCTSTPA